MVVEALGGIAIAVSILRVGSSFDRVDPHGDGIYRVQTCIRPYRFIRSCS